MSAAAAAPRKFAALRNPDCRPYLLLVLHGLFGAIVGIHTSLGLSAAALVVGTALAGGYALRGRQSAVDGHHGVQ